VAGVFHELERVLVDVLALGADESGDPHKREVDLALGPCGIGRGERAPQSGARTPGFVRPRLSDPDVAQGHAPHFAIRMARSAASTLPSPFKSPTQRSGRGGVCIHARSANWAIKF
jgi:hypothetical protein